jgi:hypothetical protein
VPARREEWVYHGDHRRSHQRSRVLHPYYDDYGIKRTSIEIAVLPYDKTHGKFSDAGDSGSIVLARDGRIVGILTGGAGLTDKIDKLDT